MESSGVFQCCLTPIKWLRLIRAIWCFYLLDVLDGRREIGGMVGRATAIVGQLAVGLRVIGLQWLRRLSGMEMALASFETKLVLH